MISIIGDRGKRRMYDPDLAEKVNRELKEGRLKRVNQEEMQKICKGYEEFINNHYEKFHIPKDITDKFNPTKEQILEFSKRLVEYKDFEGFELNIANYLTALMHSSEDNEFTIDLTELNKEGILLAKLGYKLENKKLIINGNVGSFVGEDAKDSEIIVNGSAKHYAGNYMHKSKITINGIAGNYAGNDARDSEIYIKDYCGNLTTVGKGTKIYKIDFMTGEWFQFNSE